MANYSVTRASELGEDERTVVERWLGRAISSDETISVNAWQPHPCPDASRRDDLRREIIRQAREIGLSGQHSGEDDLDDLLSEAFSSIRDQRV